MYSISQKPIKKVACYELSLFVSLTYFSIPRKLVALTIHRACTLHDKGLLGNMVYSDVKLMSPLKVLVLISDWTIGIRKSSGTSTRICQNRTVIFKTKIKLAWDSVLRVFEEIEVLYVFNTLHLP